MNGKNQINRILQRRSAPRMISIREGIGSEHPRSIVRPVSEISSSISPNRPVSNLIPRLSEVVSLRPHSPIQDSISENTTISNYDEELPIVNLDTNKDRNNGNNRSNPVKEKDITIVRGLGTGQINRVQRKQMTSEFVSSGLTIPTNTRQVWTLPRAYESRLDGSPPVIEITGNQDVRLSFHRDMGGIIQDIEIPHEKIPIQVSVPEGTRIFTIHGMGIPEDDLKNRNVGTASSSLRNDSISSCVGFQRNSTIHQIGMFRYLCKGGFIQGDRSINRDVLSSKTVFRAGDVLSCVDNLRMYTSSSISTLAVIVSTKNEENENLKVAMEGVSPSKQPKVIRRDKSSVYVWDIISQPDFSGPAIIDIITDENTDVHSILGFAITSKQVIERLLNSPWTHLDESLSINDLGNSRVKWEFSREPEPEPLQLKKSDFLKSDKQPVINIQSEMRAVKPIYSNVQKKQVEEFESEIKESKEESIIPDVVSDLPVIHAADGTALEEYKFDVSQFADDPDDDEKLSFSKVSGPKWVQINSEGLIYGNPTNEDVGLNILICRVTDKGGLSSEAQIHITIIEKILNRAPFWKPNVKSAIQSEIPPPLSEKETKKSDESGGKPVTRKSRRRMK